MAYLTLCDGTTFEGESFGYIGDAIGEVVTNTGMTGYQELITHPSSFGQLICMSYPLIGNYGINEEDIESDKVQAKGLIVRDYCKQISNWRARETLNDYLIRHLVVGIHSIDTRSLCKKIRDENILAGIITQNKPTETQRESLKNYTSENLIPKESISCAYEIQGGKTDKKLAVIDYGISRSLLKSITELGYFVKVFPRDSLAKAILEYQPCGIILSDGAGDPKLYKQAISTIGNLSINLKVPIFGIGLGHQLLALAKGANTYKLKQGHRGSNQPIKDVITNRLYITLQNHNFAVDKNSLQCLGKVTHINCNDNSIEGIVYDDLSFSVQFEPKKLIGPQSTAYLFDKFMDLIESSGDIYGKR